MKNNADLPALDGGKVAEEPEGPRLAPILRQP